MTIRRALLAFAIVAGTAAPLSSALAQTRAGARRAAPAPKPTEKADAKADAAKQAPKQPEERTGPASISDMQRMTSRDMSREALADQKRDEAIATLKKIIPKITDASQKADLYFQLAELWWEKSKFVYFREMEAYDKAFNAWLKKTNQGEELPEPKASHRESELYRAEAVKLYRTVLGEYPSYGRNDEVLFNLAYNLYETGDEGKKEGVALYWDLIKKYPDSRFVPDAYLQMGEHFFSSNNVINAEKAYSKAFETGDERVQAFARYKLAWCDFNVGEHERALNRFKEVVADSEAQEAKGGVDASKIQLKSEALRDMVLAYTMLDLVDPAMAYYEQHGGEKTHQHMARLANSFFNNGKNEQAIEAYRYLINRQPNHVDAPEYQSSIVRAYANLQERQQVLAEMQRLVEVYGPNGPWSRANGGNEKALKKAYELAEGTQRELVTEYHQEAQKTKYVETYRLAAEIYKRYLEKFSDSEHAYNLRFYYAEILYTLEELEDAATQYLKVVEVDPAGDHTLTSAYNALLCYERLAAIDRGEAERRQLTDKQKIDEGKDKGKVKKERIYERAKKDDEAKEIPKWEQKQIQASDAYVAVIDDWRENHADKITKKQIKELDEEEIVVRYKAAFLYYEHRHYEKAAERFEAIILKWPQDKYATQAADLVLDSLNVKEQWTQLNVLARKFRANTKLTRKGSEFAGRMDDLIEASAFKIVEELQAAAVEEESLAKRAEAATTFREFVAEFPKSKYAHIALYNAMINYDTAKELDKAIEVAEQLVKSYPDSRLQPKTVEYLGSFYERMADYDTAARWYDTYVSRYLNAKGKEFRALPEDVRKEVKERLPANLFNAALWYEGLGNYDKATALYDTYVKQFKDDADAPVVALRLAELHEGAKAWAKAADTYDRYLKVFAKRIDGAQALWAKHRQARALEKTGDTKQVRRLHDEIVKAYAKLTEAQKQRPKLRDAVGNAAFDLLEPEFEAYNLIKFDTTNQREIQKRLASKTQALADLQKKYMVVLGYGSPDWGIAALTRIGLGYQDFSRNLLDAPIPPGLDFEQEDMYRAILEEKAFPLEEKAIEALEKALEKSYELKSYGPWTIKAQEVMLAFRPNAYQAVKEVEFFGSEFFITSGPALVLAETPIEIEPEPEPAPTPTEGEGGPAPAGADAPATQADTAAGGRS